MVLCVCVCVCGRVAAGECCAACCVWWGWCGGVCVGVCGVCVCVAGWQLVSVVRRVAAVPMVRDGSIVQEVTVHSSFFVNGYRSFTACWLAGLLACWLACASRMCLQLCFRLRLMKHT